MTALLRSANKRAVTRHSRGDFRREILLELFHRRLERMNLGCEGRKARLLPLSLRLRGGRHSDKNQRECYCCTTDDDAPNYHGITSLVLYVRDRGLERRQPVWRASGQRYWVSGPVAPALIEWPPVATNQMSWR